VVSNQIRAILVSVDYADILAITLPYNRHHFTDTMVVTTTTDRETERIALANSCLVYKTDSFYANNAVFNKWKALEEGLDVFGRRDWMCIMDADVLWPKEVVLDNLQIGTLYTPRRRMFVNVMKTIPQESRWTDYSLHRQEVEFAGYSQIFHATDPHLGKAPWHEINWKHAGGADSFFQRKWPENCKIRPAFEVLHIGEAGQNWCGRATQYLNGKVPVDSRKKRQQVRDFILGRCNGPHRFDREKF